MKNPAIEDKWPSLIAVWNQVKGDSSDDAQVIFCAGLCSYDAYSYLDCSRRSP